MPLVILATVHNQTTTLVSQMKHRVEHTHPVIYAFLITVIESIDMESAGLKGTLPSLLGNLHHLGEFHKIKSEQRVSLLKHGVRELGGVTKTPPVRVFSIV